MENAIEHGVISKREKGVITIKFCEEAGKLKLTVEDNGVGRESQGFLKSVKKHRSMATQITKDRLELLKLSERKNTEMHIEDLQEGDLIKGTRITFNLPLKQLT